MQVKLPSLTWRSIFLLALVSLPLSTAQIAQAGIKCWTNSDGFRECGNVIPPEYSQNKSNQLNKQGVTINRTQRAKTKEELQKESELAAIKREQQQELQREEDADQLLLDTFASADDIILAKEGKLSALKSEISLRESMIEKLQVSLESILHSAADMERRGQRPTEKVLHDIKMVRTQISENRRHILNKQLEQEDVKNRYDSDLERYNQLRTASI